MPSHKVAVEKEDGSLIRQRRQLHHLGLSEESAFRFTGTAGSKRRINNIKRFCRKNHARFYFDDPKWTRSADYRSTFFKNNPPLPGNTYMCVYCGRRVRKEDITVDHIYPVAKVSSSLRLQKKLERKGIRSVNSAKNLAPACWRCNSRKGTKTGTWVLRAELGRNESLWRVRKLLRLLAVAFASFIAAGLCFGWFRIDFFIFRLRELLWRLVTWGIL